MDNVKQQVVDRLKQANNILVTVRTNPTIDLLSACIGLALVLDKMEKHATAVFSGEVPSAMEFLKPEETIEQTPNSLRDFIIALDKTKADKLRYKVEDKVVRIFITPYKTSLSQDDLEFSQGDFNIDVVVALGVHEQAELDSAITEHGRILHDATVVSINNTPNGNLGSLNWQEISSSSVSEMVADLAVTIDKNLLDEQVATALLTGVVAETARFSNDKTTPKTMNLAGELMAAGANQQLVADKLRGETHDVPHNNAPVEEKPAEDHGTLEITHVEAEAPEESKPSEPEENSTEPTNKPSGTSSTAEGELELLQTNKREMLPVPELGNAPAGQEGTLLDNPFTGEFKDEETSDAQHGFLIDQAAEIAASATGSTEPSAKPAALDLPPVVPPETPILTHDQPLIPPLPDDTNISVVSPAAEPVTMPQPADTPASAVPPLPDAPIGLPNDNAGSQTLEDIEASVGSSHAAADVAADTQPAPVTPSDADRIDEARAQVEAALKQITQPPKPIESLGAHPLGDPLHTDTNVLPAAPAPMRQPAQVEVDEQGNLRPSAPQTPPADPMTPRALDMPLPPVAPSGPMLGTQPSQNASPTAPPAVPPPFMPPFGPPPA